MLIRAIIDFSIVRLQHQAEVNVREVCPIFCRSTESFPVADIRIIGLNPLNLLFYELIICRRYPLPLLRWAVHKPVVGGNCWGGSCIDLSVAFGG